MPNQYKRKTFGLVIDWISGWGDADYYQTAIVAGVTAYAKAHDINVMTFVVGRLGSRYEWERTRNLLFNFVNSHHLDGFIILPTAIGIYETNEKVLEMLAGFEDMPIVTLAESYGKYPTVSTNNYSGMREIVDHVLEVHGCKKLAFLGGPNTSRESNERLAAFRDALQDHQVPYNPNLIIEGNFLYDSGYDAVKYLMDNQLEFDALICANDNMAIGAMTELHKRLGYMPTHLAITGFDDTDTSKFNNLTTVEQPFFEQAHMAAEMLHALIEGREVQWSKEVASRMVLRTSCGCICQEGSHHSATPLDYVSFAQTDTLDSLQEDLISSLDIQTQMDHIYKVLPHYGFDQCFIAAYENPLEPLKTSRLLLAYDRKERMAIGPKGMLYDTLSMLPTPMMEALHKDRFNIIVMALHQGDNPIGYALFGYTEKINKIFEIVRYNISVALNGSILVDSIKNQALDLERQVHERTRELSETNQALMLEIKKRTEAEEQLKKAMAELETHNSKLKTESIRDELTNLYNRRGFMKLAGDFLEEAQKSQSPFLLVFGDLDGLKQINDRFGHNEGDYAIRKTAEILNKTFKKTDIIARLSGDEFTIIVEGASMEDVKSIRETLQEHCDYHNQGSGKPFEVSISTGFSFFDPNEPTNLETLLRTADDMLYAQKLKKKLGVELHTDTFKIIE